MPMLKESRTINRLFALLLATVAATQMEAPAEDHIYSASDSQSASRIEDGLSGAPDSQDKKPSAQGKYIQAAGILDSSSAAERKGYEKQSKTGEVKPASDSRSIYSISVSGWEALPALTANESNNLLLSSEGKVINEIDGKQSVLLLEYGCKEVFSRRFSRGKRYCTMSIFRFSSPDGAYGAYSTMREGSSTIVVRGQASSEDQDSITFLSGNYLVRLSSSSEADEEAKEALGHLANLIVPRLKPGIGFPRMISELPGLDRIRGSEKFFMGPQSALRYCSLPFTGSLMLERSRGAAYADYQYARPLAERLKLMLADFSNADIARNAFNSFVANMTAFSKKTLDRSDDEVTCKMSDSYLKCGLSGTKVFVIGGARKSSSPDLLARDLRGL